MRGRKRRHVTQGSVVEPNPKHARGGEFCCETHTQGSDGAQVAEIEVVACTMCGGVRKSARRSGYVLAARDKGNTKCRQADLRTSVISDELRQHAVNAKTGATKGQEYVFSACRGGKFLGSKRAKKPRGEQARYG